MAHSIPDAFARPATLFANTGGTTVMSRTRARHPRDCRWNPFASMLTLTACMLALVAGSGPATAQTSIRPGQTVQGELALANPGLPDDSHYDCFVLQTQRGQELRIDQASTAFDSYLQLGRGGCEAFVFVRGDDDSGGGLNSRLILAGDGSAWTIRVNSLEGNATGPYSLSVSDTVSRPRSAGSVPTQQGPYTVLTRQGFRLMLMDTGSVRRAGDIASVTSYLISNAALPDDSAVSHRATANEFNCVDETFRSVSSRGYRRDGTFVSETPLRGSWLPVVPGSPGEEMFNVSCQGRAPLGAVLGPTPEAIADEFRQHNAAS